MCPPFEIIIIIIIIIIHIIPQAAAKILREALPNQFCTLASLKQNEIFADAILLSPDAMIKSMLNFMFSL
jgi:hypothetical protein